MKRFLLAGAALSLLAVAAPPARSQSLATVAIAGDTCPATTQYPIGNNRPLILTQTGILCTSGSGGGGGGGAITIASGAAVDGWSVTGGSTTDVVCSTDTGTCTNVALFKKMNVGISALVAAIGSSIPAGSDIIGKVGIDQTTPGTTNGVSITNASIPVTNTGTFVTQATLAAGSAIVGKTSQVDSGGTDATDTTNHAVKVSIVSGGSGGGAVTVADGADVTQGAKADAKSTSTDTTPVTVMQVLKEISAMEQAPASRAVTNAGTFATQATATLQTQTDTTMVGGVNVKEINAVTPLMGNGTTGTGSQRVTIASDNTAFSVNATATAATTGGATPYALQAAASTNSTNVKNAAGTLLGLNLLNTNTTIYYLRLYDSATAPTCSSATNFIRTVPVPPAGAAGGAGGIAYAIPIVGEAFANGISFCVTGGPTSTDNTNAATGVFVNIDYK